MSIKGLDPNLPSATGPAGQGDDELRALKTALQACFGGSGDTGGLEGAISQEDGDFPTAAEWSALFTRLADLESGSSGGFLPVGVIAMWSGSAASPPTGWALCDGSTANGQATPDLRDRFVVGASLSTDSRFNVGHTGGDAWDSKGSNATLTGASSGAGTATATLNLPDHTLTVDNLPAHRHQMFANVAANNTAGGGSNPTALNANNTPSSTGTGDNADRKYVMDSDSSTDATIGRTSAVGESSPDPLTHPSTDIEIDGIEHDHAYAPLYYSLAFIMYVGTP